MMEAVFPSVVILSTFCRRTPMIFRKRHYLGLRLETDTCHDGLCHDSLCRDGFRCARSRCGDGRTHSFRMVCRFYAIFTPASPFIAARAVTCDRRSVTSSVFNNDVSILCLRVMFVTSVHLSCKKCFALT